MPHSRISFCCLSHPSSLRRLAVLVSYIEPQYMTRSRALMKSPLTAVELFAGGGGMALGMASAGFQHTALVEWWKPALSVLRENASEATWSLSDVLGEDVRATIPSLVDRGAPTLLAGGPPCQPFSLAGASAGHSDGRNMFPAALEAVRALRPQIIVFENVPGLLRGSFAPYLAYVQDQMRRPDIRPLDDDEVWSDHHRRILASTDRPAYSVSRVQIDSADLGVPQNRKRVFLIGIAQQLTSTSWPGISVTHSKQALLADQWITGEYWDRHSIKRPKSIPLRIRAEVQRIREEGTPGLAPWVTLRDLFSTMPHPGKTIAPVGWPNHLMIPGARSYPSHTGSPVDSPSKTIKAGVHGVAGGEAMIRHRNGSVRYLTIREAAMAQGFPRGYIFPGSRSRMMGVIGNAVAVDVAAAIGRSVAALVVRDQYECRPAIQMEQMFA